MTDTQRTTAGWYQDPSDADALRWWDGSNWTGQVRPKDAPPPSGVSSWVLPSPTSAPAAATPRRRPAITAETPAPPAKNPAPSAKTPPNPEALAAYLAAVARLPERRDPRPNILWMWALSPFAYFAARILAPGRDIQFWPGILGIAIGVVILRVVWLLGRLMLGAE